jgi:hypothetical protein
VLPQGRDRCGDRECEQSVGDPTSLRRARCVQNRPDREESEQEAAKAHRRVGSGRAHQKSAQLTEFAQLMGGDRPDVRASLLATQFLGVVFARFTVGVEPLASMDGQEIANWLGPTFDLYLAGPLDDSG